MVRCRRGRVSLKQLFRKGYEFEKGPILQHHYSSLVRKALIFGLKNYFPDSENTNLNPYTTDALINDLFTHAIPLAPAISHFEDRSQFWDLIRANVPWANDSQKFINGPMLQEFAEVLREGVERYNLNPSNPPTEDLVEKFKAPATITKWIAEVKKVVPARGQVVEGSGGSAEKSGDTSMKDEAEDEGMEKKDPKISSRAGVFTFNMVVLPSAPVKNSAEETQKRRVDDLGRAMKRFRLEDSELATKVDGEAAGEDELPHKVRKEEK